MASTKPRLLFLYNDWRQDIDGEAGGCGWYRIVGPAEKIKETRKDWDVTIAHNPPEDSESWNEWLQEFDLIWVHHPDSPEFVAVLMGIGDAMGSKVVVDLDDNYLDVDESNPAKIVYYEGSPFVRTAMKAAEWADMVTVTTHPLKTLYSKYNENIKVIPNVLDCSTWNAPEEHEGTIIGYAGSPTHYADLMLIFEPMKKIMDKYQDVRLRFMNYVPDEWMSEFEGRIEYFNGETSYEKFVKRLPELGFDIGLAPLVDTDFNVCKSECKFLEYSAMGIPTVASRVGPYKRVMRSMHTGMLCRNEAEWEENLSFLIENPDERTVIGSKAKEYVLRQASLDGTIQAWIDTCEKLLK